MNKKIVKQYLKEVTNNLVCKRGTKAFIVRELRQEIAVFAEEKTDLSLQDLHTEFGSPKEFAAQLTDREDFSKLIKTAKKKALLWKWLGIAGVILAILAIVVVCIVIKDFSGTVHITNSTPY